MNIHKVSLLYCLALIFPSIAQPSEQVELTLAYQINPSPPYQMGTGEQVDHPPGIALDIINAAAEELNLKVTYKRYPNVRVLHLLKNGQVDGAFMFSYKPERAEIARYPITEEGKLDNTKRLATLSYWLYFTERSELKWSGTNFIGTSGIIVAEHGDSIISDLEMKGQIVQQPESAYKALEMLVKRRPVVGAALQDVKASPLLDRPEFSGIQRSSAPLRTKDYFLLLSHHFVSRHPVLAKAVWQKIEELRDEITEKRMYHYSPIQQFVSP